MEFAETQVIHYVQDMVASRSFYVDVLGLSVVYDGGPYWLEMKAGGTSVAIHPGGSDMPKGRTGLSFAVSNLESARKEANNRGAEFGEIVNPHPGVTFCETTDPDGNPVFLRPAK